MLEGELGEFLFVADDLWEWGLVEISEDVDDGDVFCGDDIGKFLVSYTGNDAVAFPVFEGLRI